MLSHPFATQAIEFDQPLRTALLTDKQHKKKGLQQGTLGWWPLENGTYSFTLLNSTVNAYFKL